MLSENTLPQQPDNQRENGDFTQAPAQNVSWCQMQETVLMIELAAGQIEAAMTDSNSSVEVLTDVFTTMAGYMRTINDTIAALPDTGEMNDTKVSLLSTTENVSGMVHKAIIAFQFYDKLVQRLGHVNHSLASLSNLISDNSRISSPGEWTSLQENIRSKYTMQEEAEMFDAVLKGMPVQDAINKFMGKLKDRSDDIELF